MSCSDKRKLVPQLEEGITDVRWMSAPEVEEAMSNTFLSVKDVVESAAD
jgi:hypothetical protein